MDKILSFIQEKPWIIFAVFTVLFFLSMIRLGYKQWRYKKSFEAIKSMRSDKILSKVYLKINNGYGDFYDVKVCYEGEKWVDAYFSEERIRPAILVTPGVYNVQFSIKSRKSMSAYHSKKGPFFAEINVKPFRDTMIVFDDDTLASWQEDYEGWKANE